MELIKTINVTLLERICSACASNLERPIREEQKCLPTGSGCRRRLARGSGVQTTWRNFKVNGGDDKETHSENLKFSQQTVCTMAETELNTVSYRNDIVFSNGEKYQ